MRDIQHLMTLKQLILITSPFGSVATKHRERYESRKENKEVDYNGQRLRSRSVWVGDTADDETDLDGFDQYSNRDS